MINRSQERIKQTGEVFTPLPLVDEILSKLPPEVWEDVNKTFLDPSCGDGNFLVRVLHYKLQRHPKKFIQAIDSIYGVDIMPDNVKQCRERLFGELYKHCKATKQLTVFKKHMESIWNNILEYNIVWHDALTYHFNFDGTVVDQTYAD